MLIVLFISFIIGCKRDNVLGTVIDPISTPTIPAAVVNDLTQVTASVSGVVMDESNNPIASAVVTSGAATTTTNSNGMFIFQNISLSKENGSVTVVKAGYFKGVRSFKTTAGKNHTVRLQLMQKILSGSVVAATGGTITSNGGATINFPAAAFVTGTGAVYSGSVNVYSRWIDPTSANLPFIIPGDLRGVSTNGAENILETYGMVGAELEDASGNTLKIATGKKATISFPLPASLQASAPSTIPLWHFDDNTARWKEDGTATRIGNTYSAQVDKFSFWNGDIPISQLVLLDYTLINATFNSPLISVLTRITKGNGQYETIHTNNAGFASLLVPKNTALVLEVINPCNSIIYTQNIGPFTSNTSLGNINITLPASDYKNFTGTLLNCSGGLVTNGYLSFYANAFSNAYANTNSSGNFAFSILNCSAGNLTFNYLGVDNTSGVTSALVTNTSTNGNAAINLGNITICATPSNGDVYAVGYEEITATSNLRKAKFWKNGILTDLTNGTYQASAGGIVLSGTDVYICGQEMNSAGIRIAKVWRNGVASDILNTTAYHNYASSIYISGTDIYVAGYEENNAGTYTRAKLWKNGISLPLTNGSYYAQANSLFVSGTDIYVAGKETNTAGPGAGFAKLWSNGSTSTTFLSSLTSSANSIFVSGNDVYVAGWEGSATGILKAQIWKNGIPTSLTNGSFEAMANSVFVVNSDVYVAGYENNPAGVRIAKFWKNGIATNLTNGTLTADASSIFILNGDVYVGGRQTFAPFTTQIQAKVWKNGVSTNLTDGTKTAGVTSIFVR